MTPHSRSHRWLAFASFCALTITLAACAGGKSINVGDDSSTTATPTPTNSASSPSFATDVYPIFTAKTCNSSTACHNGAGATGVVNLGGAGSSASAAYTSITGTSGVVDTGTPGNSLLLEKPTNTVTHSGGTQFTSTSDPDYQTILAWITAGAMNN